MIKGDNMGLQIKELTNQLDAGQDVKTELHF